MADLGYLQLTLVGTAAGQAILNILYYGNDVGESVEWTTPLIAGFLTEWGETHVNDFLDHMPDAYTLSLLSGRVVDSRGAVISDNAVELSVAQAGAFATTINGPFQVAILPIQTVRVESEGTRALKRSYLAIGPLWNTALEETGALTIGATVDMNAIADIVEAPLTVGVQEFAPVRVGRTVAPATPAVGLVTGVSVDPFSSFRKSRKRRANGL